MNNYRFFSVGSNFPLQYQVASEIAWHLSTTAMHPDRIVRRAQSNPQLFFVR
uniref:2-amino-4-hydroxy-6-hydroxymethyldihydropteridine pyrophosphokinase n=1 Tax=Ascaris lumbricoides TaxID=6252 RepID=A0A0M3IXM9_ASCLU